MKYNKCHRVCRRRTPRRKTLRVWNEKKKTEPVFSRGKGCIRPAANRTKLPEGYGRGRRSLNVIRRKIINLIGNLSCLLFLR